MKNLKGILSLFASILVLSAAIISVANVEVSTAVAAATVVNGGFYLATSLGFIALPGGILGGYVAGPGGGVQVISTDSKRAEYMNVIQENPGKSTYASFLRSEALITNGTNTISFFIGSGDLLNIKDSENRLDRNDKFTVTQWGFFLLKQPDGKFNGALHSYPNLTDFAAGVAADLESIYHGKLYITIGGQRIVNSLDMQRFRKVPRTQQSAATNYDEKDLSRQLVKCTPHVNLDGSAKNEIQVVFPSHVAWTGGTAPAGFKHYLVMYMQGMLVQQGSANI